MKTRAFLWFVLPSLIMMVVFIAGPLITVVIQSFQLRQNVFETVEQETCTPLAGCTTSTVTRPIIDENGQPMTTTQWVGWRNYRALLEPEAVRASFSETGRGLRDFFDIDFYAALRFTLTFTLVTLPLVIGVGLILALTVNTILKSLRGPVIFMTLLPFIVTPVIGALSIRWLFIGEGILTATLERFTGTDISMFAQGWTVEMLMLFYRVWHVAPFAFVIFYAALQTVQSERVEAARVDGANRRQILLFVIIPHLMPLIVFVSLIHLMDSYRVFDEIIGFRAEAFRTSLQWITYNFLQPDDAGNRSIGRASASAILIMVGVVILLIPLLRNTWREQRSG